MATVGEVQDDVVEGFAVTLLVNSRYVGDIAQLVVDVLERALQPLRAFRAIHLPPSHLEKHDGRNNLLPHEPSRPQGDGKDVGAQDIAEIKWSLLGWPFEQEAGVRSSHLSSSPFVRTARPSASQRGGA